MLRSYAFSSRRIWGSCRSLCFNLICPEKFLAVFLTKGIRYCYLQACILSVIWQREQNIVYASQDKGTLLIEWYILRFKYQDSNICHGQDHIPIHVVCRYWLFQMVPIVDWSFPLFEAYLPSIIRRQRSILIGPVNISTWLILSHIRPQYM